jgi:hypothetical protein
MTHTMNQTKTEAFAEFGAQTNNKLNEYSAIAEDGSIVLECWNQHVTLVPERVWRHQIDNLSTWINAQGKNLMMKHLQLAIHEDRPIRLIIVRLKDNPNRDIAGMDASNEPKFIIPYRDRIGKVVELSPDKLVIDFRKVKHMR